MARSPSSSRTPAPIPAMPAKTGMPVAASHGGPVMSSGPVMTGAPAAASPAVAQEKVAMRAYEKWCQRGRPCDGSDMHDWLEAERELMAEVGRQAGKGNRR